MHPQGPPPLGGIPVEPARTLSCKLNCAAMHCGGAILVTHAPRSAASLLQESSSKPADKESSLA